MAPLNLTVLTPAQAIPTIINTINNLQVGGVWNCGQATSLLVKSNHVIASLTPKPPDQPTACNQLQSSSIWSTPSWLRECYPQLRPTSCWADRSESTPPWWPYPAEPLVINPSNDRAKDRDQAVDWAEDRLRRLWDLKRNGFDQEADPGEEPMA
jgi:hypothetical protein